MPSVSIVIPVYNGAEFVGEAIDSALAQTHPDAEVVVVDDGSTDATPGILATYGSRLTVLRQPNRGLAAARNRAVQAARAEIVALLDADDRWEPGFLAHGLARLAESDARTVAAFSGWTLIDRGGRPLAGAPALRRGTFGLRDLVTGCFLHPSTVVLRRAAVLAAGGFDETLPAVEDWDLWLRLAADGGRFAAVEHRLCAYRLHDASMSQHAERMRAGRLRSLEKLFARADLAPEVRALHGAALASAYLQSSTQLFGARRDAEGARDFCLAVRHSPAILGQDETHFAIVCATQPLAFKASAHGLDLDAGESRITAALARCGAEGLVSAGEQRAALGRALLTLASLAYAQLDMAAARRYLARALAADGSLCVDPRLFGTFARSLVGARAIATLRRWRRGAAAEPV